MKIYVVSSWRNGHQPEVVKRLREAGHEVYDFKNPPDGSTFGWQEAGNPGYKHGDKVTGRTMQAMLAHPLSEAGFKNDHGAMRWADTCVYVCPCGVSASWEAGWHAHANRTIVYIPDGVLVEPELMFKLADHVAVSIDEVIASLAQDDESRCIPADIDQEPIRNPVIFINTKPVKAGDWHMTGLGLRQLALVNGIGREGDVLEVTEEPGEKPGWARGHVTRKVGDDDTVGLYTGRQFFLTPPRDRT